MPGLSRLFLDFCNEASPARDWYAPAAPEKHWQTAQSPNSSASRQGIADLLAQQNPDRLSQVEAIRKGAGVVVTGQQVGLLGGPLYVPHKASTAIAMAQTANHERQPRQAIFWLATEDHDFAEINHVIFPARRELRTLRYDSAPNPNLPVGRLVLDESITPILDQAWELLGYSDAMEWLAAAYRPGNTLAGAFAEFYAQVFAPQGLLILDASGREAHRLGAPVLQAAIERADELHAALLERNAAIESAGYHAQVAVGAQGSLLFLIDAESGARLALKRTPGSATEPDGLWQAGRHKYSTAELLGILAGEPERISPSALLRPLFQDTLLPTSTYVGGPAEIAYFAQASVLYERILGRLTPVAPRLSATLVEPAIAELLDRHELRFETILSNTEESLAQRLGARAMPAAGKQRLASAGNALDVELAELTGYMAGLDEGLGRSAQISANKMRYQMNRLRRLAATFQLQQEASLRRHAQALIQSLHPRHNLQERVFGAAYFLARYGSGLIETLVAEAGDGCPGHKVIRL